MAKHLKLQRPTVLRCLPVLERLFLVCRLRAWSRNPSKKLAAAPKVHMIDSGMAAQAAWTDSDLKLWHYRDHQKIEVDAVLTRGRDV